MASSRKFLDKDRQGTLVVIVDSDGVIFKAKEKSNVTNDYNTAAVVLNRNAIVNLLNWLRDECYAAELID